MLCYLVLCCMSVVSSQFLKLPPYSTFCQHELLSEWSSQPKTPTLNSHVASYAGFLLVYPLICEVKQSKLRVPSQLKNWCWTLKQPFLMYLSISYSDLSFDLEMVEIASTEDSIAQKKKKKSKSTRTAGNQIFCQWYFIASQQQKPDKLSHMMFRLSFKLNHN